MRERKELRREREKHFENADHSFTAAIYGQPVHFMENGEWKEIDNTVELAADGRYVNKKNDFKVSFSGDASDERLIEVGKDGHSVSWKMKGALSAAVGPGKKPDPKKKRAEMEVTGLHAGMVYKNVLDGVDLEYELRSKTLKENIVLSKPPAGGRVVFEITTDLLPETDGGRILFKTDAGEDVFVMPAPFMFDASGKESHAVEVVCEGKREHGKFLYTLIPDEAWMRAPERQWPVTIDPVISSSILWEDIQDARVQAGDPNTAHGQTAKLSIGRGSNTGICRSLVNFELPQLTPASMVLNACFDVYCFSTYGTNHRADLHRVLEPWTQSTVTWNTMPKYEAAITDCQTFVDSASDTTAVRFDITDLVRDWYAGTAERYGLLLKEADEVNSYAEFLGSDSASSIAGARPRVCVMYTDYSGLRGIWTYHTQDVRRAGSVHINDYNGNLVYCYPVASITGNRMPYSLELVYNSNDKDTDIGYGKGMRMNYHQNVWLSAADGTAYYHWKDGTGHVHAFRVNEEGTAWEDELDPSLKFEIGDSADAFYRVRDKEDNLWIFQSGGYLVKMQDPDGNTLSIAYDFASNAPRIQSVTDGGGRTLTFTYTGNGYTVTDSGGRNRVFSVSGGLVDRITEPDNAMIQLGYSGNLLNVVKDPYGYEMGYSYGSGFPKVTQVRERVNGNTKRTLSITYGRQINSFTDERGRTEHYLFNDHGQTVSVKNDKGYAQVSEYMKDSKGVSRLSRSSDLIRITPQFMKDPYVFDMQLWSAYSPYAGASSSINTDQSHAMTGSRSLKLTSSNTSSMTRYGQGLILKKGKTYTYSAYVKTVSGQTYGGGAGLYLLAEWQDSAGTVKTAESRKVKDTSGEWERVSVAFTLPADAASDYVIFYIYHVNVKGTSYVDHIQLEEGQTAGRCNLVENNDLTYDLYGYDYSYGVNSQDGPVDMTVLAAQTPAESTPVRVGKVQASSAYVRTYPGNIYPVILTLSQGHLVRILATENDGTADWYKIRFGYNGAQYEAWIKASEVTLLAAGTQAAVVRDPSVHFRKGPGTGYSSLLLLTSHTIVLVTGASGDWQAVKAMHAGTEYSGYVPKSSITVMSPGGHLAEDHTVHPAVPEGFGSKVYRIRGALGAKKCFGQKIPVSGKAGDAYMMSGWGCGKALPLNSDTRHFGLLLEFIHTDGSTEEHHADFGSDCDQWQFAAKAVVAKNDYTSMRISYCYEEQENTAFFQGLSLFKDMHWNSFTYDADGNIQSCADAKNDKTSFEHNSSNDLTKVTTPTGANFTYTYDEKHRITKAVSGMETEYHFDYDDHGNVTEQKTVDKNGTLADIRARYTYTDGCYPKEVIDYFGKKVEYTYDKNTTGNLTQVKDVNGKITDYTYDTMDRLLTVKKKNTVGGAETDIIQSYGYENDRLKTITHNGMNYTFTYDALGNMTKVQAGSQTLVTHTYSTNPIGRLSKSVLGNNTGVAYDYDVFDRVTKKKRVNSDGTTTEEYVFTYDNEGYVAKINDKVNNNVTYCEYSLAGELAHVRCTSGPSFWYTYDANNALTKIRTNLNGKEMSYTYDKDLREVTSKTMNGKTLTTMYDGLGRVTGKSLDTTTAFNSQFGYRTGEGGMSTPVIQTITQGGKTWNYSYYDDGNISQIVYITKDANGNTVTYINRYQYDALGQLIRVDDQLKNKTVLYTYDAGFNMTSEKVYAYTTAATVSGTPESQRTFAYASGWKDQLISVNGTALSYDGAGNLVSCNGRTFTWKNGRQLAGTTGNGTTVSYTYDHNGMRVSKTVGNEKHTYVYAGSLLLQEKTSNLALKFSYDSLGNPIAVLYNNGEEYYYVKNLQGDIVGLVNKDGEWVVEYRYDAWGNILSTTGSLATTLGAVNPFRYRGYYYDAETGFYYASSRYYDPEAHRFISPDTTDILGVDSDLYDKNLYAYCDNNPVVRADSDGTLWYMAIGAAIGGIISGGLEFISQAQAGGAYDISKILIATASGAAGGLFAATSLKIGAQIAINAGIGVGSYIADSVSHNEAITLGGVVSNGLAGVASGAIGGHGANGKMLQNSWKVANKTIAKEVRRNSYKYSAKRIAQKTAVKAGIKKTTGVATARFTGGTFVSRAISNIGKSVSTWWKNLWK